VRLGAGPAPLLIAREYAAHPDARVRAQAAALLGEIGVPCHPVLIFADPLRTTDDLTLPMVQHFNHCIAWLPPHHGQPGRFLDGTAVWHPTDTLPDMDQGAQVLIVVNVGTPVDHVRELGSALGVAQQMINVLTEQNAQRSLSELQPADLLIQPDLEGLDASALSTGAAQAIAAGEAAALALRHRLGALGVDATAWQAFEQARTAQAAPTNADSGGARLLVRPTGRFSAELLAAAAGVRLGQTVDAERARQAADRLYASGDFERVEVQSALLPDGRAAILVQVEAP
jgi:hypothetical protein